MARTSIGGGCKYVATADALDTEGFGKVTFFVTGGSTLTATAGPDAEHVDVDIKNKVIDATTGVPVGAATLPEGINILSYIGNLRFVTIASPVLLSEPRMTN